MAINVIDPGLATTIQDLGRPGYYHLGIPMGGAMDRLALRAANLLVGNPEDAAGLEVVFSGPTLEFTADGVVAVTGAELPPVVDGDVKETWMSVAVKKGQVLSFDYLRHGARAYIAFAGGIATPPALGSRSTYGIGALGGINGRGLLAEDLIPLGDAQNVGKRRDLSGFRVAPPEPQVLRVLSGLYSHRITADAAAGFYDDTWKVAPEADRMGYRFQGGSPLAFVERDIPFGAGSDPSNIVDGCYPYGSIQVPGGKEPIVLHRDAVSGGGYFMLGTVISADMDHIAQLQPHFPVRFAKVDMAAALRARKERRQRLGDMRAAVL